MQLPAEIKSLCARVALEKTRPMQWQTGAELRKQAQAMLASGQPQMMVHAHLQALLADSLAAQARR